MIGLYEYDTATKQECVEDLTEIIEWLNDNYYDWFDFIDLESLEKKGQRIQYISQRLKVFYENGQFVVDHYAINLLNSRNMSSEIIGNIHDNKNLIGE